MSCFIFRLALLHNWETNSPRLAIDFTHYDLPANEPQILQREWSLMNVLNQKGTRPQDKSTPLAQLTPADQRRIFKRTPTSANSPDQKKQSALGLDLESESLSGDAEMDRQLFYGVLLDAHSKFVYIHARRGEADVKE